MSNLRGSFQMMKENPSVFTFNTCNIPQPRTHNLTAVQLVILQLQKKKKKQSVYCFGMDDYKIQISKYYVVETALLLSCVAYRLRKAPTEPHEGRRHQNESVTTKILHGLIIPEGAIGRLYMHSVSRLLMGSYQVEKNSLAFFAL